MAELKLYRKKRDFKKTPEPKGHKQASRSKHLYIIQKHAASHLHYDFRLEINHVLKSWAIPKGPSLDPTVKRLAVHVEDHPLEYGSFEGIIPKGEYGGGTVLLWDKGTWQAEGKVSLLEAYKKGDMTFYLKGKKLKGLWKLIQIKKDPKNWLLIKVSDQYARPEKEFDIVEEEPDSVISHQNIDELSNSYQNIWTKQGKKKYKNKTISVQKILKSKKSPLPSLIYPELATLVDKPPLGENWLHEIKFDGYRLLCFIINKKIKIITRNQNDWTHKFSGLIKHIKKLNIKTAILDGELVALNKQQQSDFQELQNALHDDAQDNLIYYIFDIIYYNDYDLTATPLIERKKLLKQILIHSGPKLRISEYIVGEGEEVFKQACKLDLEGIVAKEIDSTYQQRRTQQWLKIKCSKRQEFVVGGFTPPRKSRTCFGSLLIGIPEKNNLLTYAGHVGTGFNQESLYNIYKLLKKNVTHTMPFTQKPPASSQVTWVKPKLVVEIEFTQWTREGILRHPSFKGLRLDKPARQITMEKPMKISHPDRIYYPEDKITKQDLVEYYQNISTWILPYVINRPLSVVRCPAGYKQECFFQKHITNKLPEGIYSINIKEKTKTEKYFYIKDLTGLISLVQMGVLEIHPWGCTIDNLEKPDLIVFDLDPSPEVNWEEVIRTAKAMRKKLQKLNLESFVKTSGGKGLHVVVPIKPKLSWPEMVSFAHAFTDIMVAENPDKYIGTMSKQKRIGKIFIDYLRNNRGATTVAAYSTRAKIHAPVSTPLSWTELTKKIKADGYNISNLEKRLAKLKTDPWSEYFTIKQIIPAKFFKK